MNKLLNFFKDIKNLSAIIAIASFGMYAWSYSVGSSEELHFLKDKMSYETRELHFMIKIKKAGDEIFSDKLIRLSHASEYEVIQYFYDTDFCSKLFSYQMSDVYFKLKTIIETYHHIKIVKERAYLYVYFIVSAWFSAAIWLFASLVKSIKNHNKSATADAPLS